MKFFVVLLFTVFGISTAVPFRNFENELQVTALDDFLTDLIFAADDDLTVEEVKKQLQKHLDDLLEKIKEAIDQGKAVKEDVLRKVKEIRAKMKDLGMELSNKGKELLEKIREKTREYLRKILEKLGLSKRVISYHVEAIMQAEDDSSVIAHLKDKWQDIVKKIKDAFERGRSIKEGLEMLEQIRTKLKEYNINLEDLSSDFLNQLKEKVKDYWNKLKDKLTSKRSADVFGFFERLKQIIKEKFDPERLKEIVEKYFGKGSELAEQLINLLKERGEKRKQKILDWIDRVLGEKEQEKRFISDVFEDILQVLKDINLEIGEKFAKFAEWVKKKYENGLKITKDRLENVKNIAKEFLQDTKQISKDVAEEALDYFREYEHDLGVLYHEIRDKVKDILKQ